MSSGTLLGLATMLAAAAAVHGQFIDGGEVPVTCTACVCEGTTDIGDITVYDQPGNRVREES